MKIKEKVLKRKEKCNWCGKEIGTNEFKCLKCQGYLLAKEETIAKVEKIIDETFQEEFGKNNPETYLQKVLKSKIKGNKK